MKKQTLRLLSAALILTILLACVPAVAENGDKKDGETPPPKALSCRRRKCASGTCRRRVRLSRPP